MIIQSQSYNPIPPLPTGAPVEAVVVLGGGAPNGAMMAGAMAAIYDKGKTFTTIYTSGAGALVGMLYAAPRMPPPGVPGPADAKLDPTIWALRQLLKFGIADEIYRWFPVGYKTFFKSGPLTRSWMAAARALQVFEKPEDDCWNRQRRLYNDLIDLWASVTCPSDVTMFSQGLCGDFPFASDIIDFAVLNDKTRGLRFYMNAHHIESTSMQEFGRDEDITPEHFDAALSYPFIYPPAAIKNEKAGTVQHYFEGGCVDPLNLEGLANDIEKGDIKTRTVIIVDVLSTIESSLVRVPKDLWDAFGISIMLPVVSLARMSQKVFALRMKEWNRTHDDPKDKIETTTLSFNVPPSVNPQVTDWSASNMQTCWNIGYAAGLALVKDRAVASRLPDKQDGKPYPVVPAPLSSV